MPFEIPQNWVWVRLEDICEINLGLTHTPSYVEDGIPFVSAKDISSSLLDLTNTKRISKSEFATFPYGAKPHKGDVLFCRVGTIGHPQIVITEEPFGIFVSVGFLRITNKDISNKYLKYWMESPLFYNQVESDVKGATRKNLNTGWLKDFYIPIPPLNEQVRIVRSIQSYFALLYEIEAHKSNLQDYIKTTKSKVLSLAISGKLVPQDPNDEPAIELLHRINPSFKPCDTSHYENLPSGWTVLTVGEVADYINGRAFKPSEWEQTGLPIIRIQNLNDEEAAYNYSTAHFEDKYLVHNGDLLFAWAASLGTYIWQKEDAWLNQHIFKVIPKPFIERNFLYYSFINMIDDFYAESHGSGMVHITKGKFETRPIHIPPLAEQKRIVERIETIFAQLDTITAEL